MPDDYLNTIDTAGSVGIGGTATGFIETARDKDWFAVELVAGRTYVIDLEGSATDGGALADPLLRGLYDADGNRIAGTRNDDGGEGQNSRLTFTATESGTFYIAARGYRGETGSYTVRVTDTTPPPPSTRADAADLGDITELGTPAFLNETLDADAGAVNYYRFELTEAKRVGLGLRRQDADADLIIEDADGNVLHESRAGGTANEWLSVTLLAGTWYVRVEAQEAGSDGYRLRYGVTEANPAAVARLQEESEPQDTQPPPGTATFVSTPEDKTPPEEPLVGARQAGVGPFAASTDETAATGDFSDDTSTTGRLAVGEEATGRLGPYDYDYFAVWLEGGHTYVIELRGRDTNDGTLANPFVGITGAHVVEKAEYGTSNRYRETLDNFRHFNDGDGEGLNARTTLNVIESGMYWVIAASLEGPETSLRGREINRMMDDLAQQMEGLAYDSNAWRALNIERVHLGWELQELKDATREGTYTVEVSVAPPPPPVGQGVSEPDGQDLPDDATTTGLVVVDGGPVTGVLSPADDLDWFAVELDANMTYRFKLLGDTNVPQAQQVLDTYFNIHDSSGIGLEQFDSDNGGGFNGAWEIHDWTPTEGTGTYYVEVAGYDAGAYTLEVEDGGRRGRRRPRPRSRRFRSLWAGICPKTPPPRAWWWSTAAP